MPTNDSDLQGPILPKVFISHSNEDADVANKFAQALEDVELSTWLAPRDIPGGANYAQEIMRAILEADVLLVLLTPKAISSPHVKREVDVAINQGKTLLPVLLEKGNNFLATLPSEWDYWLSIAQIITFSDFETTASQISGQIRSQLGLQKAKKIIGSSSPQEVKTFYGEEAEKSKTMVKPTKRISKRNLSRIAFVVGLGVFAMAASLIVINMNGNSATPSLSTKVSQTKTNQMSTSPVAAPVVKASTSPLGAPLVKTAASPTLSSTNNTSRTTNRTWKETTGQLGSGTFLDPHLLTLDGGMGIRIGGYATVEVSCRVSGAAVADRNSWYYRVSGSPWSDHYYGPSDNFYNNGNTSGSLNGTPYWDPNVPLC